jgi:hypothetical protein
MAVSQAQLETCWLAALQGAGGHAAPEEKGRLDRRPPAAAREPTMTGDEARLRFCKRSYTA